MKATLTELFDGEVTGTIKFPTHEDCLTFFIERTSLYKLVSRDGVGNAVVFTFYYATPDFIQHEFQYIICKC